MAIMLLLASNWPFGQHQTLQTVLTYSFLVLILIDYQIMCYLFLPFVCGSL